MIKVVDLVALTKENTARILWKLANVKELLRPSEGVVRSAEVRALNGDNRKPTVLRRPIQY